MDRSRIVAIGCYNWMRKYSDGQTARPPVFFAMSLATRPTSWNARALLKNIRFKIGVAGIKITFRPISKNTSHANVTAGRRKDAPKTNSDVSTDTLSQIMSVISIIDINGLADLAKSFKAASNSVEKLLILAKHASLVDD
ncbi:hypothetical protein EVAR_57739_1 [Eumeta japonica]|uniref:Uncharacterized protein n=1 Tax=Eumeta variegata TaxID=151549 RepID=A0A4C1Y8V7_EUMVA|nr:hypothetical protein EVAR_57739_1 [Eumeta japonica]